MQGEKKREDYTFQRRLNEKPSITLGCPGMACKDKGLMLDIAPNQPYK